MISLTHRFSEVGPANKEPSTVSTVYSSGSVSSHDFNVARFAIPSIVGFLLLPSLTGAAQLAILPFTVTLHGPEARQHNSGPPGWAGLADGRTEEAGVEAQALAVR